MSAAAPPDSAATGVAPHPRHWFTAAGAALVLVSLLPPIETLALRYVLAETVQFAVFALVAPLLIVLGAPWRTLRLSVADPSSPPNLASAPAGPADRAAASRRHHRSFVRAAAFLLVFMGVALAWRLPPAMGALVRHPALIAVELITLLGAGIGLWLELVPSPPFLPRLPRPQRAAVAALAMWFLWVIAYVIGLNNGNVFSTYGDLPGRALSLAADQQIAAGIMWAAAGFSFIPVVFTTMLGWLRDSGDADEELQRIVRDEHHRAVVKGWGPPQRGPKAPPA